MCCGEEIQGYVAKKVLTDRILKVVSPDACIDSSDYNGLEMFKDSL
jgi:hypothetical protein